MGTIPGCLFRFRQLTRLGLDSNLLTGDVPRGILTIPNLRVVNLSDNRLSGSMDRMFDAPAAVAVGESPIGSLSYLGLHKNRLTGTVPSALSDFVNLSMLRLEQNSLVGTIGSALCGNLLLQRFTVDCDEVDCFCCTNCV